MAVQVHATGVVIRLATPDEVLAERAARRGHPFRLTPDRSFMHMGPEAPLAEDEVLVVSEAFVEFTRDEARDCWRGVEHHGFAVPKHRDATLEILELADETVHDLIELLAEMRIAGFGASRWELMSAPRRIELEPGLRDRLAPLRRG